MVDNSWIDSDRANIGQHKAIRLKVYLCIAIVILSGVGVVALHGVGSNSSLYQAEGILIDYGEYRTYWTNIPQTQSTDPVEMLDISCKGAYVPEQEEGLRYDMAEDGTLTMVEYYDGINIVPVEADETHSWDLWTVDQSGKPAKTDDRSIRTSDYKCVIWAYTQKEDGKPAVTVDATNTCIYGYSQPSRLITLSPVSTEIVWSVGALNTIVGTDSFSDYPATIKEKRDQNLITTVGTYLAPSYESIMN